MTATLPTFDMHLKPSSKIELLMTSTRLFRQIVTDTQKLLRLKLQFAQGNTFLKTEIDQLNQAISLKQALLDGLQPPSADPHP